jgi:acetyltransferase
LLQIKPDIDGARLIIESTLKQQRKILTSIKSKAVLAAFGIPITQTIAAHSVDGAIMAAESIGFPSLCTTNCKGRKNDSAMPLYYF